MTELATYTVETLWEDGEFVLSRRVSDDKRFSLLVSTPASAQPTVETVTRLDHAYAIRKELDSAWAARPVALERRDGRSALLIEDPGGEVLAQMVGKPWDLTPFLHVAIGLAVSIGRLHSRGFIHKDVKPSNILVKIDTGELWLVGFGIASRLPRERQAAEPPEIIAGTLAYMAPEQTGRMNRSIDSRSDLYSLGVTLYQMLTGSLPFTASDPMEWVHCHIARKPVPPSERLEKVPSPVSHIIMKLLAKTAEERYQTAAGVESDLRRCLATLELNGRIDPFALGAHDTPDRLLIPEKLYGRAREVNTLLASFDRIVKSGRPELVLVSGYSGIGKSAVVNELHKPLVPPRGLFASGKFDQYKRDIPYATLAQAFQSLTRPLLSKGEEELSKWRNALHEALDPNGQLMVSLVPELKAVIGEQPPVPELPQQDAQRRFHLVFRRFINVFARPEHPLALFLDDLQWLDTATLDLMEDLLTQPDVKHLMLIGAYRDNEVDPTHPLVRKLEAMRQAGALLQDIVLAPLTREDLEQLIADSLRCEPRHAGPLAELVHDKTIGNPFFSIQFMSALFEEGLLTFDHVEGRWSWDLAQIHAKGYTDNVVDLMVDKLSRLPLNTQKALQQFACLGNSADFSLLELVHEDSTQDLHDHLQEALRTGLVLSSEGSYRFLHDRVQEAVYSLIPEERRAEAHLRIGRLMAAHTSPNEREEGSFEIVNQLNRGAALISSRDEKEQLAEFNLIAGKRAKATTAYVSALRYLVAGTALLADGWDYRPDLMSALEVHRAECEFLTGELAAAETRLAMLVSRAADPVDLVTVACLRIDLYTTLGQSSRAVAVGLDYLRRLGVEWSPHPTDEEAEHEYERIWSQLGGGAIEALIDLPLMSDAASLASLDVLTKLGPPTLYTDINLRSLTVCRAVNLSLDRGNCDASCYAYAMLGMIAGALFGDYQAAYRFGRLGYDLVERHGFKRFQARTYMVFGSFIMPWTRHIKDGRDLVSRAFEAANKLGDLTFAAYTCNALNDNMLAAGDPLVEVQRAAENGLEFARKIRYGRVIDVITVQLALVRTLRGLTPTFGSFNDGQFDELRFERHLASDPALALSECWYWIRKVQMRFFAGDYPSAIEALLNAERLLWTTPSHFVTAEYHFYGALCRAAVCDTAAPDQRQQHVAALAAHHHQLERWAEHCPANFANRAALVGAEIARLEGRILDAEHLYEQAIWQAREQRFIQNEGLANELAARFYAARGFKTIAHAYLRNARYGYQRWGADGKVRQLDQLYPHLREQEPVPGPMSTILAPTELLDLATVIKVSQAVSGEMVLEKLIDRLMRAAIEHAGAERGLLILPRGDQLLIQAEATTGGNDVTVHQRDASSSAAVLPESIVHYVVRTQESVMLDDASAENPFSADTYVRQHHARSILCLPLMNQAKLIGVLYLENNLTPHVFTLARIALLKLLASQAAISLENALLYGELQEREAKIRRLVDANIMGVFIWNLEGEIIEANEAFLHIVGYSREDLVSGRMRWTDLTPAEWRDSDERGLADLRGIGTGQPFEKEFFRKDGSRVPVLAGGALFEEVGNGGVAFVLDLTERKLAENALRESQENLARSEQFSLVMATHTDLEGRWLKVPPTLCKLLGYTEEELLGCRFYEFTHPDDADADWNQCSRLIRGEIKSFDLEKRYIRKDGSIVWVYLNVSVVLDASGAPIHFRTYIRDITQHKQQEQALRRSEERYRTLAETATDVILTIDQTSTIVFVNATVQEVFGYTPAEIVGQKITTLMPERMRHRHEEAIRRYLETGEKRISWNAVSLPGLHKNGSEINLDVSFAELDVSFAEMGAGDERFFGGILRDVTERKRTEETLRKTQADLAHVTRVATLGEMSASIAHEINQPLGAIVNNASACLRWLTAQKLEEARQSAVLVVADGHRAGEIIGRIRALAKKAPPQKDWIDINETIREVIALVRGEVQRSGIALETRLSDYMHYGRLILADRIQIQQVILNLIINAIEATSGGADDGPRALLICSDTDETQRVVSVRDSGPGLDPKILDRLFDAFYTTKPQGMGMGLAISRSIIEAHGGRLWGTANDDRGATFQFTLPIAGEKVP